jgi:hypothetical protein
MVPGGRPRVDDKRKVTWLSVNSEEDKTLREAHSEDREGTETFAAWMRRKLVEVARAILAAKKK